MTRPKLLLKRGRFVLLTRFHWHYYRQDWVGLGLLAGFGVAAGGQTENGYGKSPGKDYGPIAQSGLPFKGL